MDKIFVVGAVALVLGLVVGIFASFLIFTTPYARAVEQQRKTITKLVGYMNLVLAQGNRVAHILSVRNDLSQKEPSVSVERWYSLVAKKPSIPMLGGEEQSDVSTD